MEERPPIYAYSIHKSGGTLDECLGFVNGTKIRMSRPGDNGTSQESAYSGHKKVQCIIYQTLTTSNGLIFLLYGLAEGRSLDLYRAPQI